MKFSNLFKKFFLNESNASDEAHKYGLTSAGWGHWKNDDGDTVAYTDGDTDQLVWLQNGEKPPKNAHQTLGPVKDHPPAGEKPAAPENTTQKQAVKKVADYLVNYMSADPEWKKTSEQTKQIADDVAWFLSTKPTENEIFDYINSMGGSIESREDAYVVSSIAYAAYDQIFNKDKKTDDTQPEHPPEPEKPATQKISSITIQLAKDKAEEYLDNNWSKPNYDSMSVGGIIVDMLVAGQSLQDVFDHINNLALFTNKEKTVMNKAAAYAEMDLGLEPSEWPKQTTEPKASPEVPTDQTKSSQPAVDDDENDYPSTGDPILDTIHSELQKQGTHWAYDPKTTTGYTFLIRQQLGDGPVTNQSIESEIENMFYYLTKDELRALTHSTQVAYSLNNKLESDTASAETKVQVKDDEINQRINAAVSSVLDYAKSSISMTTDNESAMESRIVDALCDPMWDGNFSFPSIYGVLSSQKNEFVKRLKSAHGGMWASIDAETTPYTPTGEQREDVPSDAELGDAVEELIKRGKQFGHIPSYVADGLRTSLYSAMSDPAWKGTLYIPPETAWTGPDTKNFLKFVRQLHTDLWEAPDHDSPDKPSKRELKKYIRAAAHDIVKTARDNAYNYSTAGAWAELESLITEALQDPKRDSSVKIKLPKNLNIGHGEFNIIQDAIVERHADIWEYAKGTEGMSDKDKQFDAAMKSVFQPTNFKWTSPDYVKSAARSLNRVKDKDNWMEISKAVGNLPGFDSTDKLTAKKILAKVHTGLFPPEESNLPPESLATDQVFKNMLDYDLSPHRDEVDRIRTGIYNMMGKDDWESAIQSMQHDQDYWGFSTKNLKLIKKLVKPEWEKIHGPAPIDPESPPLNPKMARTEPVDDLQAQFIAKASRELEGAFPNMDTWDLENLKQRLVQLPPTATWTDVMLMIKNNQSMMNNDRKMAERVLKPLYREYQEERFADSLYNQADQTSGTSNAPEQGELMPVEDRVQKVWQRYVEKTKFGLGMMPRPERAEALSTTKEALEEPNDEDADKLIDSLAYNTGLVGKQIERLRGFVHAERRNPTRAEPQSEEAQDTSDTDWSIHSIVGQFKLNTVLPIEKLEAVVGLMRRMFDPVDYKHHKYDLRDDLQDVMNHSVLSSDVLMSIDSHLAAIQGKPNGLSKLPRNENPDVARITDDKDVSGFAKRTMVEGEETKFSEWDRSPHWVETIPEVIDDRELLKKSNALAAAQHRWRIENLDEDSYHNVMKSAEEWQSDQQMSRDAPLRRFMNDSFTRAIDGPPPAMTEVVVPLERGVHMRNTDFIEWIKAFKIGEPVYLGASGFTESHATAKSFSSKNESKIRTRVLMRVHPNEKNQISALRLHNFDSMHDDVPKSHSKGHQYNPSSYDDEREIIVGTQKNLVVKRIVKHVYKDDYSDNFLTAYEIIMQYDDSLRENTTAGFRANKWEGLSRNTVKAMIKYMNCNMRNVPSTPSIMGTSTEKTDMKIEELHALIRKELFRVVVEADLGIPDVAPQTASVSTLPGAPMGGSVTSGALISMNNEARYYIGLWARLAKVCVTKYGQDASKWPPKAVKACTLLGAKAQTHIGIDTV